MNEKYALIERAPTVDEYQKLRMASGWNAIDIESAKTGMGNSLYSVCAILNSEVIGSGRVIGDGGIYYYIQDVIVLPEFQRRGIGKRIMEALMAYLRNHAHPGAFIGLMAAKGTAGFYRRFGFRERPSDGPGMYIIMER